MFGGFVKFTARNWHWGSCSSGVGHEKEFRLRKIIHVGMGKTGTTHLQQKVFPELDRLGILRYHTDWKVKYKDVKDKRLVFDEFNRKSLDFGLDNFADDSIHLISNESILSWDPRHWQTSLSNLLSDFGEESEILITLRDPYSYLRSLYQQRIHEGESDLVPERYFLRSNLYDKHQDYFGRSNSSRRLSVDELDYNYLFNLFSKKFDRVYFSDMKTTMEYKFLVDMNIIDKTLCKRLRGKNEKTINNKAYSRKAMLLDIKRYKILNAMNLSPLSSSINERNKFEKLIFDSSDLEERDPITHCISKNVVSRSLDNFKRFIKQFRTIYKILKLPYNILKLPYTILKEWRSFLQGYVNVLFKYEKFELPAKMYLGKHFEDNVDFYKELPLSKGYKK